MQTIVDSVRELQSAERTTAAVTYAALLCDPARQTPDGVRKLRAAAEVLGRSLGQMNDDLGRIAGILDAARLAKTEAAALQAWADRKQAVRDSLARIAEAEAALKREREAHQGCIARSQEAARTYGAARDAARNSASNVCHFWRGLGFEQAPDDAPEALRL